MTSRTKEPARVDELAELAQVAAARMLAEALTYDHLRMLCGGGERTC